MPYARRRYTRSSRRRVRRTRTGSRPLRGRSFRTRAAGRRFRRPVTGIPNKKSLKVRKDFFWTVPGSAPGSTYNIVIAGGAQHGNLQGWGQWSGNNISPVSLTRLDNTGSTGLSQWFNFYNRYVVHASKLKVEVFAPTVDNDSCLGWAITLVPTVNYNLATGPVPGTITQVQFDNSNIDPGELPFAKKILIPNDGQVNNSSTRRLSSFISVKKMLNIKDINDVVSVVTTAPQPQETPFVPAILSASTVGNTIQSMTVATQTAGIFWNLVFQEIGQRQEPPPATPFHGALAVRITQTSYVQFSDRKPLTT